MTKPTLSKEALTAHWATLARRLNRYRLFLFILAFLSIYGFLIVRVNSLTHGEPPPVAAGESLDAVRRLRLDQASINKLQALEAQNIEVRALFQQARDNPFTE